MVAVEHDVVRVDFTDGIECILGRVGVAARGQRCAFKCHARLNVFGEKGARLKKEQLVIEITKRLLRLQVQLKFGPFFVALQRIFDGFEQVVPTDQKFDGVVEHVKFFAQGVLERPGQRNHALL